MLAENKIWVANNDKGERVYLSPKLANRHGLVAGATGTGKTVTLKVMAESFSDMGVPVFLADVKGDLSGIADVGVDSPDMQARIAKFGLAGAGFSYKSYPVTLWDLYGEKGIQLRTTVSEMGPLLLARIMDLNELQSDILSIVFKIADDNNLLLIDTKDLKAMLNHVSENSKDYEADYGKLSPTSIAAIVRAVVALEINGGETFFGETALNVADLFTLNSDGRGMINILDSSSLISNGKLYSTFLLWLLSELFECLPEVGDLDKPKMVFFFDEAHLLFKDAPKALVEKVEQVVKLIRSKGVGVYFCTQNPKDIPNGVLAQLGNKVQHALHAYTPADQKAVKAAAESYRENPEFNTYETIMALGTGEAVVSFLEEGGVPGIVQKVSILPPQSRLAALEDAKRDTLIKSSLLYTKYAQAIDPDSAYEFLMRKGLEDQARADEEAAAAAKAKEEAKAAALAAKEEEKAAAAEKKAEERAAAQALKEQERLEASKARAEAKAAEMQARAEQRKAEAEAKAAEKKAAAEERKKKQAIKSVGNSVAGTVGREVGKQVTSNMGSFGKKLGGNVGASVGRGLFSTLFKL